MNIMNKMYTSKFSVSNVLSYWSAGVWANVDTSICFTGFIVGLVVATGEMKLTRFVITLT